jgi:hypothetical protein
MNGRGEARSGGPGKWQTSGVGALPSGTVTFLLTDVEGSTPMWTSQPAVMSAGISRHYDILDEVILAHGGARPVEQGEGDSVVAAFALPSEAPLSRAAEQHLAAMVGHAETDPATAAATARQLIATAAQEGYVLMQINGLELLALSATLPGGTNATILAAADSARDRIGYRGRWPNLATDVIAATDTARGDHPAAFERGLTENLPDICSQVTSMDYPAR